MRKNRIFGMLSATSLLFAGACSNDVLDQGKQTGPNAEENEGGVFVSVLFDLPSAKETRSFTNGDNSSNDGTEVGHEYENTVSSAYIVLAKASDNSFIAAAQSTKLDAVGTYGISYRSSGKFSKTQLGEFYNSTFTDEDIDAYTGNYKVNVFVFANPTNGAIDALKNANFGDTNWVNATGWYDEIQTPDEGKIWTRDYFLMTNSAIATRLMPSTLADWDAHTTEASAFNLTGMNHYGRPNEIDNLTAGNISVERAAARYDFRDGALDGISNDITKPEYDLEGPNGFKDQTYHVVLDSDRKPLVDVFLGKMSMVNMNNEFYFLRRVSDNGLPTGERYKLLGAELPWYTDANGTPIAGETGNYVVDPNADWKVKIPTAGFSTYFNYPFFNDEGVMDNAELSSDSWSTVAIKDVLTTGVQDTWKPDANGNGKYRTWRYLTEGTVPEIESQTEGVANGIVFKGQMQPARRAVEGDDQFTKKLLNALEISEDGNKLHDPILYEFEGHIYCTWEHIRRIAIYQSLTSLKYNNDKWEFSINRSTPIYTAVFGTGGFGSVDFTCEATATAELKNANFLEPGTQTLTDTMTEEDTSSANAKYSAWKAAFPGSDDEVEDNEAEELVYFDAFRKAAVDKSITLYQTSYDKALGGWGYYCYYYYWNRHNDNGNNSVMCPMEFDVVRNNVYKLAVTRLARLGHPRISANDPDKPTPDTPCEEDKVYITVTCTTLPWVVRENNIVFK